MNNISTFNPWKIDAPFAPMFDEQITLTHLDGVDENGMACVFPIETVDPFADSDTENMAKALSVLLKYGDEVSQPLVGEKITLSDGTNWNIGAVDNEQTWWKLTCRGGLRQ